MEILTCDLKVRKGNDNSVLSVTVIWMLLRGKIEIKLLKPTPEMRSQLQKSSTRKGE